MIDVPQSQNAKTPVQFDEALTPTVYAELHRAARRCLRKEWHGRRLQPTELLNEAVVRLLGDDFQGESRKHFVVSAVRAMRRVLVDQARRRQAGKRIPDDAELTLETRAALGAPKASVLEVDDALARLARVEPRAAEVVELRYFGGLTCPEAAEALGLSRSSVEREWRVARAWLRHALG